jgi:hypothetical protein
MKYAVEVSSGAMIYISSFIKIFSAIQKLIAGDTQTYRQHGYLISLLLFLFRIRKKNTDFYLISHRNSSDCIMYVEVNPRTLSILIYLW